MWACIYAFTYSRDHDFFCGLDKICYPSSPQTRPNYATGCCTSYVFVSDIIIIIVYLNSGFQLTDFSNICINFQWPNLSL